MNISAPDSKEGTDSDSPATQLPNGPASAWFRHRTTHASPCGPPVHAVPAGICATSEKFFAAARLSPANVPGTFCVTCMATKSVALPDGETSQAYGPAPSWLTWCSVIVTEPSAPAEGRPAAEAAA
jgi:hypothetical protein